ncbi:MAG TPA: ribosome maturation factor RimP [Longimicrobiales bacterium]|nr:ribosome maturation factor RimP [Longimicrobiales bacterium]
MRSNPEIEAELEARVEALGYEFVAVRWGGSGSRPSLGVRIDRPGAGVGEGVTVDDCAKVSRALEPWLDGREDLPERYVLEVSSPGVDRPLLRDRDYERFRGEQVAIKGHDVLAGRARRLEGELLGLEGEGGTAAVRLRLPDGDEVSIPRNGIAGANLVFTWKR